MFWIKKAKNKKSGQNDVSRQSKVWRDKQYTAATQSEFKEALDATIRANDKAWENLAQK